MHEIQFDRILFRLGFAGGPVIDQNHRIGPLVTMLQQVGFPAPDETGYQCMERFLADASRRNGHVKLET